MQTYIYTHTHIFLSNASCRNQNKSCLSFYTSFWYILCVIFVMYVYIIQQLLKSLCDSSLHGKLNSSLFPFSGTYVTLDEEKSNGQLYQLFSNQNHWPVKRFTVFLFLGDLLRPGLIEFILACDLHLIT